MGDIDFVKEINEKFGLKTFIENDANAAAYAEFKTGNAKGDNNTIIITLGTGIGGGIIVDGKLLRGKSGVSSRSRTYFSYMGKKTKMHMRLVGLLGSLRFRYRLCKKCSGNGRKNSS